jgi:hypothetical protein
MATNAAYLIRILSYNESERTFSPRPAVFQADNNGDITTHRELDVTKAKELGLWPSREFMEDYAKWNKFENHPVFATSNDLIQFNATGRVLAQRLQEEIPNAIVEPFQPLYTSLELGNCISGWWHVKDRVYGCILPIQQLPISDDLKSKLMAWRHHKCMDWLNEETVQAVNEEGRELEEHLLWELNVSDLLCEEMGKVEPELGCYAPIRSDSTT